MSLKSSSAQTQHDGINISVLYIFIVIYWESYTERNTLSSFLHCVLLEFNKHVFIESKLGLGDKSSTTNTFAGINNDTICKFPNLML